MLNRIIGFSIRNKLIIGIFILALTGWGLYALQRLPIDALPDITSNQVQVITVSPTLAAPEVERLISFTVEQSMANIPGIKEMRSISRFGLSVVTIVFDDDTDVYWARQQVAERLPGIREQIPDGAGLPEMAPSTTGLGEIYQYVIRARKGYEDKYSLADLRSIQDWIIRRQLLGTAGVADVSSFGGQQKQYEVAVLSNRLKSMNTTVTEIFMALENNNQNSGGAYIERNASALFIRTEGLVTGLDEIGSIVVKYTADGIPVRIRDVADVRLGHAVRYGAMVDGSRGEVAGAVVLMLKGANASQVVNDVKARMELIKKTLPEGVEVDTFYDRTKMVNRSIGTVKKNLLEGAAIVIVVLLLFLGNLRAGLIVASVIPLSMLFAVSMMNLFGLSGNLMSLGALDFGLIVDGAVIIVEAVLARLYHSRHFPAGMVVDRATADKEVGSASAQMMNAAVFGQIIILIVYMPILSLTGIEGKMFRPMAQTVSLALVGAFLLSLTYVPMITALGLNRTIPKGHNWSDRFMEKTRRGFQPLLEQVIGFPKWVAGIALLLFALSLVLLSRLGGEFIPELEEGDFAVDLRLLTGSSLTASVETGQKCAAMLEQTFPEVEKVVLRIGAAEIPTDPMPIEVSDIMIQLKDKSEWVSAHSFDALADTMSKTLSAIPGITAGFQFPVQMRFNELISGARQDVVCKIYGDNLDTLARMAQQLGGMAATVPGTADLFVEAVTGLPQIVIKYNRDALARFRLSITGINKLVRAAFAGESAGLVYENERRYDLVVRLAQEGRQQVEDIRQLQVPTPDGLQIPLYQVADIQVKEGPSQIQRENARRRIIVGFNVRGRDVQSVVHDLQRKIGQQLKLPVGYSIDYGGQFKNLEEAKGRLSVAVPVALLLILLLLYLSFNSLADALLIFSAIPLSAIGGVLALTTRGLPFSISAGVGFIALFGVAVLNGIVLIAAFKKLEKEGMTNTKEVVLTGTSTRLRPVLMTAAVASLGFLPMALSQGAGAEVQRPLATVVIGGLMTATLLTLLVLPALYLWVAQQRNKIPKKALATLVLLFAALLFAQAQTGGAAPQRVPLDTLLNRAAQHNLSLLSTRREADYWQQLSAAPADFGITQAGAEYGHINSFKADTRFFVNQSVNLPVVYRQQRNLLQAEAKNKLLQAGWKQAELFRQVRTAFCQLVELEEREKLIVELDSIYTRFLEAASLRLQAGESNELEKVSAEAQVQQLALQKAAIGADRAIVQKQLQQLTQQPVPVRPAYHDPVLASGSVQANPASHPQLLYQQQQAALALAQGGVEKAKLAPELSVGYGNQSIIGYASKDGISQTYYGAGDRFHLFNLTVGLPIFMRATKTRVRAASVLADAAGMQAKEVETRLSADAEKLQAAYNRYRQQLDYYNQTGLALARHMNRQAMLAFTEGEIDYLQWIQLMNQSVGIRLQYIDAITAINNVLVDIEYLNAK
ncbi:MAG: CusA/CzcA family heavy metal efflux RND transporter [Flavihumibacter sp.]